MKTLDQVEARTPLVAGAPGVTVDGTTGAITITAKGSYYLTGNLTTTGTASCIDVGSHTVSLDLNGFTISRTTGTESNSAGILIFGSTAQKVMIKNGFIVGGGTSAGFAAAIEKDFSDGGVHVQDVHVTNVRGGISLFPARGLNSVRNCSVDNSGGIGIEADVVGNCTVRNTSANGIYGVSISNCTVTQQNSSNGIVMDSSVNGAGVVSNCRVTTNSGIGVQAIFGTVVDCFAHSASNTAISAYLVTNSVAGRGNVGVALQATTANGCAVLVGTVSATNKYNMP